MDNAIRAHYLDYCDLCIAVLSRSRVYLALLVDARASLVSGDYDRVGGAEAFHLRLSGCVDEILARRNKHARSK